MNRKKINFDDKKIKKSDFYKKKQKKMILMLIKYSLKKTIQQK